MDISNEKKVGIMGGTFNPIHNGHLLLAESARKTFNLEQILFMPSGNSYLKQDIKIVSAQNRANMTALAIQGNPYFTLSTMEINRTGPTYTYETLKELKDNNPNTHYYFITGADSLLSLHTWRKPEVILSKCTVITAVRGGESVESLGIAIEHLKKQFQADIEILPIEPIDLSSSEIRRRIANGQSVQDMLPDKVLEYINENHFYDNSI